MMARYRVLVGKADKNSDGVTLVHDGFRPVAFIMPVVWLFWHRLWLHGALMFAVNGFAAWAGMKLGHGANPALLMMTNAALGLITALEGPGWIAARLERNGAAEQGVIMASSLRQAEEICAAQRRLPEATRAAPGTGFRPVSPSSLIPLTGA